MTFYVVSAVFLCVTLLAGTGLNWASALQKDRARARQLWKAGMALCLVAFAAAIVRSIQVAALWPEGDYPDEADALNLAVAAVILLSVGSTLVMFVYSFTKGARDAVKNSRRD